MLNRMFKAYLGKIIDNGSIHFDKIVFTKCMTRFKKSIEFREKKPCNIQS